MYIVLCCGFFQVGRADRVSEFFYKVSNPSLNFFFGGGGGGGRGGG